VALPRGTSDPEARLLSGIAPAAVQAVDVAGYDEGPR
jgi:hypothetical protein